jgi:sugar (pentulose or hexulose) kinase
MACIGAAILAGKGTDLFKTEEEGCKKFIKKEKEILPDKNNSIKYGYLFDKYKKSFNILKQLYLRW